MGPPTPFQTKFSFPFLYFFLFLRYIGSMVADVHRTLKYGGIFMYPATGFLFKVLQYSNPCPTQHRIQMANCECSTSACLWPTSSNRRGALPALDCEFKQETIPINQSTHGTRLFFIGSRFWTSLPRNFTKEARSSWVVATMSTTY